MLVSALRLLRALAVPILTAVSAYGAAANLGVPLIYQEQGYWCWAAADQMVRSFRGYPVSQCGDAQAAVDHNRCGLSGQNCCSNHASCNTGCTSQLQYSPLSYIYTTGAMSWSRITDEINNGWPFIIVWNWDTGGSHMRVGKGYSQSGGINWINGQLHRACQFSLA
jgi:hypothetical protein